MEFPWKSTDDEVGAQLKPMYKELEMAMGWEVKGRRRRRLAGLSCCFLLREGRSRLRF